MRTTSVARWARLRARPLDDTASKNEAQWSKFAIAPSERKVKHCKSASKAEPLCDNSFKVSAAASVGASVLCTEVSTGHPHPVPATNRANRKGYRFEKPRNHNGFWVFFAPFFKVQFKSYHFTQTTFWEDLNYLP